MLAFPDRFANFVFFYDIMLPLVPNVGLLVSQEDSCGGSPKILAVTPYCVL